MYNVLSLGESLKDIIFENSTTVKEVCKNTDICTSQFYRWQNNTALPSLAHLVILADYFKCSVDYLIGREKVNSVTKFYQPCISERLAVLLKNKNIKPHRVYKHLKISSSVFYNWLNGRFVPLLDNILKLADYFDCTIDYLIGRDR